MCVGTTGCPTGSTCNAGDCVPGCTTDPQCNTGGGSGGGDMGSFCAVSLGICVECLANSQCGNQGYCQPDHTCGGG